jgi:hypothetical protein
MTRYPYDLKENPYPSSPTPTLADAKILGGKRHKEANAAVMSCIEDLYTKINGVLASDRDFRLITLIQDVGSGKTHLSLHIRGLQELSDNSAISYVDLSQISPRDMHSLYRAILEGFTQEHHNDIRRAVLNFLKEKAESNIKNAKKVFNYGVFDLLKGRSLANKAEDILHHKIVPNYSAIHSIFTEEQFSPIEISMLKLIIEGKFTMDASSVKTLEDIIVSLAAVASLNWKFLKKLTIFQIDEFDSDSNSLGFIKAVINAHLPSTLLMLILTPSSYQEISKANSSVFDRLEKANYKIDLAGSNTLEEIVGIVLEYIKCSNSKIVLAPERESDLISKIKVIYDEFPDFRNIRSMINILYHAMENAAKKGSATIDDEAIDDTIRNAYPGLKIKGSIMDVPLSDFIKIRRSSNDVQTMESDVRDAVKNLVNYTHDSGTVAKLDNTNQTSAGIDLIYDDPAGSKVAVAVVLDKDHTKNFELMSDTIKSHGHADKLVILTDSSTTSGTNGTSVVNIDRHKMIDLIYFSSKYRNNSMVHDDSEYLQRALMLAKSINLS